MQNSFLNNSNIQKTITTNRRLRNLSFGLSIHNPSECKVLTKNLTYSQDINNKALFEPCKTLDEI
ncbi:hypothetical protein LEP1GSC170_1844 [Leptospira interrogans serovar Bataviae str. HAI135]|nr:hypothetical protein LEP1GSC170_1844 [Leptospira interrogans serovar Bataviae str. HAI135]